jgi:hypothetical protein
VGKGRSARHHPRVTPMQWRAYFEVMIEGRTQAQTARKFGVTQPAICRRLQRYRQRTSTSAAEAAGTRGRKRFVRPIQLSIIKGH